MELSRGRLHHRTLTCWAHEWTYDACTGKGINPDDVTLRRYPLKIQDDGVWVGIDD